MDVLHQLVLWVFVVTSLLGVLCSRPMHADSAMMHPSDLSWTRGKGCARKVSSLMSKMSLSEKISQLGSEAPGIPRLGVPGMSWWSEGIHGLMSDQGEGATLFPSPLALGSSWDPGLAQRMGRVVAREALAYETRAKQKQPYRSMWGRASETYGEDPSHMAHMAAAYVQGVQGDKPDHVKVGATCKHFAAHSLESSRGVTRHNYDAQVDDRDLAESYLPAFEACVRAGARSVMCSYNRVNGVPACANPFLLQETLRDTWNFTGFTSSDCWAISDLPNWHHWTRHGDMAAAVANATTAGCDLICGDEASHLNEAVSRHLIEEDQVDVAVTRVLTARCQRDVLGPGEHEDPVPMDVIGSPEHLDLAREIATKSLILLVNRPPESLSDTYIKRRHTATSATTSGRSRTDDAPLLPVSLTSMRSILVVGWLADATEHLLGTYYSRPSGPISSVLSSIRRYVTSHDSSVQVQHVPGLSSLVPGGTDWIMVVTERAHKSDLVVVVVGSSSVNGNSSAGMVRPVFEAEGLDRDSLRLPGKQEDLVWAAGRAGVPVVVILLHGGAVDVSPIMEVPQVGAVISMGWPGQVGCDALPPVLFGDVSPSGRSSVTWLYDSYTWQSHMDDMSMREWPGRTYKYLQVPALFGFGHGLSYISWQYHDLDVQSCDGFEQGVARIFRSPLRGTRVSVSGCLMITLSLTNDGAMTGDEVVLAFMERMPHPVLLNDDQDVAHVSSNLVHGSTVPHAFKQQDVLQSGPHSKAYQKENAGEALMQAHRRRESDGPLKQLLGFRRVTLQHGETVEISFQLWASHLSHADHSGVPNLDTITPARVRVGSQTKPLDLSRFKLELLHDVDSVGDSLDDKYTLPLVQISTSMDMTHKGRHDSL